MADDQDAEALMALLKERERILTEGLSDLREMVEADCDQSAIITGIVGVLANAKAVKP